MKLDAVSLPKIDSLDRSDFLTAFVGCRVERYLIRDTKARAYDTSLASPDRIISPTLESRNPSIGVFARK